MSDVLLFEDMGRECVIDTTALESGMIVRVAPSMLKFFEAKIKDGMVYPFAFKRHGCIKDEVKKKILGYLFKVQ
jgi:hypothetical protein